VQILVTALKYLTVWGRFSYAQPSEAMIGVAAVYFPVVGLVLGLLLAVSNYLLLPYLHPEILSVILITVLIIGTGGIHLEGLKQTFGTGGPEKSAEYGRETESLGIVAIVLVIFFKVAAADSMDERLALSLILTPVLARWALVIFIYGYSDRCEQSARLVAENVRLWHLLTATLGALAVAVYFLGRRGLWVGLLLSLFALLTRTLLYRRQTFLIRANFGAIVELEEAFCLILLASL